MQLETNKQLFSKCDTSASKGDPTLRRLKAQIQCQKNHLTLKRNHVLLACPFASEFQLYLSDHIITKNRIKIIQVNYQQSNGSHKSISIIINNLPHGLLVSRQSSVVRLFYSIIALGIKLDLILRL